MKNLIFILIFLIGSCSKESIAPNIQIGDKYQDGIVFYLLKEGDIGYKSNEVHGFVAYKEDLPDEIWGCVNAVFTEFQWEISTGESNTNVIIEYCPIENAASKCKNIGWWLPNSQEMLLIYSNKDVIKNITLSGYYWTSNKSSYNTAFAKRFSDGQYSNFTVSTKFHVRPIKKF